LTINKEITPLSYKFRQSLRRLTFYLLFTYPAVSLAGFTFYLLLLT